MTNHDSGSSSSSQNISGSIAAGGNWLGFSLSPHMAAAPMEAAPGSNVCVGGHHVLQQQHHHHHGGLFFPPAAAVTSSSTSFCYGALGGGHDNVTAAANGGYSSGLSSISMPLKSDGSLCMMEALRRSEQEHHGVVVSASPKLEDFLGAGPVMAPSLDNSSFYYGHHGHGQDHGAGGAPHNGSFLQPLQCAVIPGAGGHDVYAHAHAALLDEQSAAAAAAMAAGGWLARGASGYDTGNGDDGGCGAGAMVPAHGAGHLYPLTLSMSSGSQSSCVTTQAAHGHASAGGEYTAMDGTSKKRGGQSKQPVHRKSIDTFGQRTSQYRGVTRHRWTGRYEAHLWDSSCKKEGQTRKGRQVYLGGYDMEEKAARSYDLAALKYWGPSTHINFPLEDYREELEEMKNMTRQEYVAHLRRKSSGFSRGASIYRGVTRHHQHGRWQARIGRVSGNKDLYLGTFGTQEAAAEAYDVAAITFRGLNAVTNFDITGYDVDKIMASNTLLPGELARRKKDNDDAAAAAAITESAAVAYAAAALVQAGNATHWKVAAALPAWRTATPCSDEHSHHHDLLSSEALSVLHDILSVDSMTAGADADSEQCNASAHMSNASSLATSLSNAREQSPDRGGGLAMLFAKPAASKMASPLALGSWVSSSPVPTRPGVSIAPMPLFAAWTDA